MILSTPINTSGRNTIGVRKKRCFTLFVSAKAQKIYVNVPARTEVYVIFRLFFSKQNHEKARPAQ